MHTTTIPTPSALANDMRTFLADHHSLRILEEYSSELELFIDILGNDHYGYIVIDLKPHPLSWDYRAYITLKDPLDNNAIIDEFYISNVKEMISRCMDL